jgi:nicotinic acid mononucleotide adenylyltransferase
MDRVIRQIGLKALSEINEAPAGSDLCNIPQEISSAIENLLKAIQGQVASGRINPWVELNTMRSSGCRPSPDPNSPIARIGVFPLAGNPIHWGHIITSLFAVSQFSLDTMIFLPAGQIDYKPVAFRDNVPELHRFQMTHLALEPFNPLLRYTDVASGTTKPGESAVHDLLRLNIHRSLDLVLVWGIESIERVRRILQQAAEHLAKEETWPVEGHEISIAFVKRKNVLDDSHLSPLRLQKLCVDVELKVDCRIIECDLPILSTTQSTRYRDSLNPSLVPKCVHDYAMAHGFYATA